MTGGPVVQFRGVQHARILIADDSRLVCPALRSVIESHKGWLVCAEAHNGSEAVALASRCRPDLVILDLAMPDFDGLTAARRISEMLPEMPILLHTAFAVPQLETEANKCGVRRIVQKSDVRLLISAIEELLGERSGRPGSQGYQSSGA